jgi:hypothetical protein
MHSLPAIFTLPIHVRPYKFRALTMLVVLLVFFFVLPPFVSHTVRGCSAQSQYHWALWDLGEQPVPNYYDRGRETAELRELLKAKFAWCSDEAWDTWWQADSITH